MAKEHTVRHLMLFFCLGNVSLTERKNGRCEVIKFRGEKSIPYEPGFWDMMERYITFEDTNLADLCVIGDKDCGGLGGIGIPERITSAMYPGSSVWNIGTLKDALRELSPGVAAKVCSPDGIALFSITELFPNKNINELIWYNMPDEVTEKLRCEKESAFSGEKSNALTEYMYQKNKEAESRRIK